jgi:hypothetical protein
VQLLAPLLSALRLREMSASTSSAPSPISASTAAVPYIPTLHSTPVSDALTSIEASAPADARAAETAGEAAPAPTAPAPTAPAVSTSIEASAPTGSALPASRETAGEPTPPPTQLSDSPSAQHSVSAGAPEAVPSSTDMPPVSEQTMLINTTMQVLSAVRFATIELVSSITRRRNKRPTEFVLYRVSTGR